MSGPRCDAVVAGAGPAGLIAAWRLAAAGRRVVLLDALPEPGRKLLATGAGKCNLTNILDAEGMAERFGEARRFVLPALRALPPEALRRWFANRGVPTAAADGFHYFPVSQRAVDVLAALTAACRDAGVVFRGGCGALELLSAGGAAAAGVVGGTGEVFRAAAVVIASGGLGYPRLGGRGSGYRLARQAGHTLREPVPALVGLRTREAWPGECRGIVLEHARAALDGRIAAEGELVFSHRGISGPAVIDVSGEAMARLAAGRRVTLTLALWADRDAAQWRRLLDGWRREHGRKQLLTCLSTVLPAALARRIAGLAGIAPERRAAELTRAEGGRLIALATGLELEIVASEGWEKAMVTRGGVDRAEVNPRTMESRLVSGLYFAGEVLDVDGPCGGFNLQWAFSSGWQAGAQPRS